MNLGQHRAFQELSSRAEPQRGSFTNMFAAGLIGMAAVQHMQE